MRARSWLQMSVAGVLLLGGTSLLLRAVDDADPGFQGDHGSFAAKVSSPRYVDLAVPPPPPPPPSDMEGDAAGGIPEESMQPDPPRAVHKPGLPDLGPKLIRRAELTLEVADPQAVQREILGRLAAVKGWVAEQSEERDEDGHVALHMQLRLPAEAFEGAEQGLRGLGKVLTARTQTEDVSRQWVDREARLVVKRAAVARLKQLLAQRTASLKDLLEAERALVRETEEIESLEAIHRLQARQVAFATLDLALRGPHPAVGRAAYGPLDRFGERLVTRFGASLSVLGLFLITLSPWAVLAGLGVFIYRRRRRQTVSQEIP